MFHICAYQAMNIFSPQHGHVYSFLWWVSCAP